MFRFMLNVHYEKSYIHRGGMMEPSIAVLSPHRDPIIEASIAVLNRHRDPMMEASIAVLNRHRDPMMEVGRKSTVDHD